MPKGLAESNTDLLSEIYQQNLIIIANQEELKLQNDEIIEKLSNLSPLGGYNED